MAAEMEKKALDAVKAGDLATLEALVHAGGGNVLNSAERPLLLAAVSNGHEHIIRWLLSDEGGRALGFTNVLGRNRSGDTALLCATDDGHLACCKEIVEGCKVENGERGQMLNEGFSLHYAAAGHDDIIRWLLSNEDGGGRALGLKSETITALDNYSHSALHSAAFGGYRTCVEALLSGCTAGERIKLFLAVSKPFGWTVLHVAARWRQAEAIVELLHWEEAKMIMNHRDHRGMTVLHRIACNGGLDKESRFEWRGDHPFRQPCPLADVVRALLGLDPASTRARVAFVDVNAGLEIPEEIKIAAAAEEAKKRAASETKEINVKRSRK